MTTTATANAKMTIELFLANLKFTKIYGYELKNTLKYFVITSFVGKLPYARV